jgi:hypothetical protein
LLSSRLVFTTSLNMCDNARAKAEAQDTLAQKTPKNSQVTANCHCRQTIHDKLLTPPHDHPSQVDPKPLRFTEI